MRCTAIKYEKDSTPYVSKYSMELASDMGQKNVV